MKRKKRGRHPLTRKKEGTTWALPVENPPKRGQGGYKLKKLHCLLGASLFALRRPRRKKANTQDSAQGDGGAQMVEKQRNVAVVQKRGGPDGFKATMRRGREKGGSDRLMRQKEQEFR